MTGVSRVAGQFPESHALLVVGEDAVLHCDRIRGHAPVLGCPLAQLRQEFLAQFVDCPARAEGRAAAIGAFVEADAGGAHDHGPHIFIGDAQRLGELHGDRGAAAADVHGAFDQAHRAVGVDGCRCAGLAAPVAPCARCDAAPAVLACQRRRVMGLRLGCQQGLFETDALVGGAIDPPVALHGTVAQAKVDGIDAKPFRQLVHDRFAGKNGVGPSRRAIGGCLGAVHHHVVPVDLQVLQPVGREECNCTQRR